MDKLIATYHYPGRYGVQKLPVRLPTGMPASSAVDHQGGWFGVEVHRISSKVFRAEDGEARVLDLDPAWVGYWPNPDPALAAPASELTRSEHPV